MADFKEAKVSRPDTAHQTKKRLAFRSLRVTCLLPELCGRTSIGEDGYYAIFRQKIYGRRKNDCRAGEMSQILAGAPGSSVRGGNPGYEVTFFLIKSAVLPS